MTEKAHVASLPAASVAVYSMGVDPTVKSDPGVGPAVCSNVTLPELSVLEGGVQVEMAVGPPGAVWTVTSVGHVVNTGASVSVGFNNAKMKKG